MTTAIIPHPSAPIAATVRSARRLPLAETLRRCRRNYISLTALSILLHCAGKPRRMSDLAERAATTTGNMSQVASNLLDRCLVERDDRSPLDRRVIRLRITPAGEALLHHLLAS
jgi:DNA-binding MarR family transcriptional regulator